jgi:hypothetical protein
MALTSQQLLTAATAILPITTTTFPSGQTVPKAVARIGAITIAEIATTTRLHVIRLIALK